MIFLPVFLTIFAMTQGESMKECLYSADCGWCGFCVKRSQYSSCFYPFRQFVLNRRFECNQVEHQFCSSTNVCGHGACLDSYGYQVPTCICDVDFFGEYCDRKVPSNLKFQLAMGFGVFFSQISDEEDSTEGYTIYQVKIFVTVQYLGSALSVFASTSEGFEIILREARNDCGSNTTLAPYRPYCPGHVWHEGCQKLPDACKGLYSGILDFPYNPASKTALNIVGDYDNSVPGYLSDVDVVAKNDQTTVYKHTFKVMVDFNNLAGCRQGTPPEINVEGCARFSHHTTTYFRSMEIPFYFSVTEPFYMLQFIVFSMPYFHQEKSYIMDLSADITHAWTIPPYTLKVGKYKLRLLAKGATLPSVSNFEDCYFTVDNQPLVVILEGGTKRFVRKEDGVFISGAKSYDPNEPLTKQANLRFLWTCRPNCNDIIQASISKRTMRVSPEKLSEGKTFTFTLTISAPNVKPASASQEITVLANDIHVSLSVVCLVNCNKRLIPIELLLLQVRTSSTPIDGKFNWTYNMPEESEEFHSVDGIYDESYPTDKLCIKPNSLEPGKVYQFQVTYCHVNASYRVTVDTPPHNGTCTVFPSSGIAGITLFDITCEGYISYDQMIVYEYYNKHESEPVEKFNGRMLGSDRLGSLLAVHLTREVVVIFIYNVNGYRTISTHKIHLEKKQILSNEVLESNLKKIKHMAETGHMGSLTNLTSVLDFVDNKTVNLFEKSIEIIKTDSIEPKTLPDIKTGLLTFDKILALLPKSGGVKIDSSTAKGMTKYLRIIAEALNNEVLGVSVPFISRPLFNDLAQLSISTIESILTILSGFLSNVHHYPDINYKEFSDLKKIAMNIICTINYFTNAVSFRQSQGLHHLELKSNSNMSSLIVLTDYCSKAINRTNSNKEYHIKLPKDFIDCSLENTDSITIQSTSFKAGSSLIPGFHSLATKLVSVEVFKRMTLPDGQLDKIKPFQGRLFDLFMDVETANKPGIISISTTLPNLEIVDRNTLDNFVTIVRVDVPQGCKMFVKFVFNNASDQIRVKIQSQLRPTYQLMMESSTIVNSSYATLDVPFEIIDEDDFMYIGVVPGPTTAPGESVNCTVSLHCNICLTLHQHHWVTHFCSVGSETTLSKIHCRCHHLSLFCAVFLVPPNALNPFADIRLLLTIKDNPYIVLFVVSVALVFSIFCAIAISRDRKQAVAREILYLEDNFPSDKFVYIVAVFTGSRLWSGTDANVGLEMMGTAGRSRAHILKATGKNVLRSNTDDWFFLATPTSLGTITKLHIWHDSKGLFPDWYCDKIIVYDVANRTVYTFFVEDWIAFATDQYPEAVVVPATADDYRSLTRIFFENLKHGVFHSYILASICSRFRDVEMSNLDRVLVLWCIAMSASLVGIAFYKAGRNNQDGVDDPHFSFGTKSVIRGSEMFLVNLLFIVFFQTIFKISYRQESEENYKDYNIYVRGQDSTHILKGSPMFSVYLRPVKRSHLSTYEKFVQTLYKVYRPMSLRPVVLSGSSSAPVVKRKPIVYAFALLSSTLAIALCSFFIILYGLKMGEVKSINWMCRIVVVLIDHFLLLIPVKIILVAVVLASHFIYLVPISNYKVNIDSIAKFDQVRVDEVIIRRRDSKYHPLNTAEMLKLKEKRTRIISTYNIILLFFLSCALVLLMDTFESWNGNEFYSNNNVQKMFERRNKIGTEHFDDITNRTQYVHYLLKIFVDSDAFYRKHWYNTYDLNPDHLQETTSWAHDCTNQLVGVPMLRQLRVIANASCTINRMLQNVVHECIPVWSENVQDTDNYGFKWTIKRWNSHYSISPWEYQTPSQSKMSYTDSVTGKAYPLGGYFAKLGMSRYKSNLVLLHLKDGNWVDHATQVVFGALTLYNVNVNVFTQLEFVAERLPSGFYLTKVNAESTEVTVFEILYASAFVAFVVVLIVKAGFKIYSDGVRKFVSKVNSMFQIFIVITGIMTAGLLVMDIYVKTAYVSYFQKDISVVFFRFCDITKYEKLSHAVSLLFFTALIVRLCTLWPFGELYLNILASLQRMAPMIVSISACLVVASSFRWNLLMFLNVDHFSNQDCALKWTATLNPEMCLRGSFVNVILFLVIHFISAIILVLVLFHYTLEKYKSKFES